MYYIVGSDNQSHGPVDESTLKEWIGQGRAIAQTQACKEGNSEWKALSLFSGIRHRIRKRAAAS